MVRRARAAVAGDEDGEIVDFEDRERELEQAAVGDLELFDGPEFSDYEWTIKRVRSREEIAADPTGPPLEFWTKKVGPLDYGSLRDELGGGAFELRGYVSIDGTRVLKRKPIRRFAGPRLQYPGGPMVGNSNPTHGVTAGTTGGTLERILERLDERLARLESNRSGGGGLTELVSSLAALDALRARNQATTPPAAPAVPVPTLSELVTALKGMDDLRGGHAVKETNPIAVATMVMESFTKGIDLGQQREPIPADAELDKNYMPVIEKGLELLAQVFARRRPAGAPPPPPPPAAGQPAREPSAATVVEEKSAPKEDLGVTHRWQSAIEALYRSMAAGESPITFAASLDSPTGPLNTDEVNMLRGATTAEVHDHPYLKTLVARFPALETEQGRVYLTAVLAELRNPTEPEDETPAT